MFNKLENTRQKNDICFVTMLFIGMYNNVLIFKKDIDKN